MIKVDEYLLRSALDVIWRTPFGIRSRFKIKGRLEDIQRALDRLAAEGHVERMTTPGKGIRARRGGGGRPVTIQLIHYRRAVDGR